MSSIDQKFAFEMKQIVRLVESGETGVVIGRAEFTYSDPSFLVRYKAGDGRQVEAWWTTKALEAA